MHVILLTVEAQLTKHPIACPLPPHASSWPKGQLRRTRRSNFSWSSASSSPLGEPRRRLTARCQSQSVLTRT